MNMSELKTEPGEVRMTIQIKRAATGKVEEFKLVGRIVQDNKPFSEEKSDVSHT
jgi:hypothetical protein